MEFKIEKTVVYGLDKSMIASGNAMRTVMQDNELEADEKDFKRACTLGRTGTGEGHDNFLNGIIVQFDLYAPLYMWKQIQRYHWMDFISSQSTMHRLTKFNVAECCVGDTDEVILERYQFLLDNYKNFETRHGASENRKELMEKEWRTLVASLPSGFVLGATMTTNYRQLKTVFLQRKHHKLKEWREFCRWCESLPHFKEMCVGE